MISPIRHFISVKQLPLNLVLRRKRSDGKFKGDGPFFLGVHAGQGFARASLVTQNGKVVKGAVEPTNVFRDGVFYEQSSDDIWRAVTTSVKRLVEGVNISEIKGIGIVATPSLICLDEEGNPVTASVTRKAERNGIMFYDQRASQEAEKINETNHNILRYFGGKVSTDLQETKLLWLKHHLQEECWEKARFFFDLPDFLTWKATGSELRSSCVTKWSYQITNEFQGWDKSFLSEIGLEDFIKDEFVKIGQDVAIPGTPIKGGLSEKSAKQFGLPEGTPVGLSMEHTAAAALALLGCKAEGAESSFSSRLCSVCGTFRTSHFMLSHKPSFSKGIRGPLKDNVIPGMYSSLAQQAAGASLIDHVIDIHVASQEIRKHLHGRNIQDYLNKHVRNISKESQENTKSYLAKNIHILPDFHGNVTPYMDPSIKGMMSGLTLSHSQESLALRYLAVVQSLAYATRNIVNLYKQAGNEIKYMVIGGQLSQNQLFTKVHKNALQLPVIVPQEINIKTIGAAMLGAIASKHFMSFEDAILSMGCKGTLYVPKSKTSVYIEFSTNDIEYWAYHPRKGRIVTLGSESLSVKKMNNTEFLYAIDGLTSILGIYQQLF